MSAQGRSVSVVVAAWNVASKIDNCLLSILSQTHPDVEIIVVDGVSTDGTLDILERYGNRIKWTSERDRGVNEAQWKGVLRSSNEWILFLGADDYLACPEALERFFRACPQDLSGYDILTGHALYEDGRLYRCDKPGFLRVKNCIHGQGALYRRALFAQKAYDLQLMVYYDYEFNLWALTSGKKFHSTGVLLSIMGPGGLSDRPRWRNYVEDMRARARYVTGLTLAFANLFAVMRYLRKVVRVQLGNLK
jgi:glycosyltransferase involved in cell wall biosynthesis